MHTYRNALPQLNGHALLTDSGLETTLVFHEGIDLPCFASYPLLGTAEGRAQLETYFERHLEIARQRKMGFLLEAPTWRASPGWGKELGHDRQALQAFNAQAIEMMCALRDKAALPHPVVISGNIGPRGDGYQADTAMTASEAQAYHADQVGWFAQTAADMVSAFTLCTVNEAVGIVRAAVEVQIPAVIAFTVETDGCLADGTPLGEAITQTDAATNGKAAYFMVNCAHPEHFEDALRSQEPWLQRLRGIRANASRLSHEELDNADVLDDGNPAELGASYGTLQVQLPHLSVFGGCCGTDSRHIAEIANNLCCARAA